MHRGIVIVLAVSGIWSGCQTPPPPPAGSPETPPEQPATPEVTPAQRSEGRVALVEPQTRHVVLDFSYSPLPVINQRFDVYRQGKKVGEIKVTGPARGEFIAGDLVSGEAAHGDEVRP